MEVYLVGGAVRDELLGQQAGERDYVVVGATPGEMEARGFRPVGKDFPVFLHPETREEYALARTERKTGPGYHGFAFHASPEVTLEEDLARRDLTINAMARDGEGRLIDPFGGREDLERRRLRHVTAAFAEDPVRILRLGRFAARLAPLGFRVAEETMALCREMVAAGEADHLVAERVWQETRWALMEAAPRRFLEVLRECGALARVLPEVDALFGVPQRPRFHPEVDTGVHILLVMDQAARLAAPLEARWAALLHDAGKARTPEHVLPSHRGHERRGLPLVAEACERLRVPRACRDLALLVTRWHLHVHRAWGLRPGTALRLLERLDVDRRPERLAPFLLACEADFRGRLGNEEAPYPQAAFWQAASEAVRAITGSPFAEQGLKGPEIAEAVREARLQALADLRRDYEAARD